MKFFNDIYLFVYVGLKEQSFIWRVITIYSLFCIVFAIAPFCPFIDFSINGQYVSFTEFWQTGWPFLSVFIGLVMFIIGIGLLKGNRWAKPTFGIVILAMCIVAIICSYI